MPDSDKGWSRSVRAAPASRCRTCRPATSTCTRRDRGLVQYAALPSALFAKKSRSGTGLVTPPPAGIRSLTVSERRVATSPACCRAWRPTRPPPAAATPRKRGAAPSPPAPSQLSQSSSAHLPMPERQPERHARCRSPGRSPRRSPPPSHLLPFGAFGARRKR